MKSFVRLLFILSGACGLIYEVAWSKYLSLFVGSTAYAYTIVMATFMGGLALGAWYWGRFADRTPNRLRLYGLIEIAVGLYCLAYPLLIGLAEKLFIGMAMGFDAASHQGLLLGLKFFLSFLTLIVPTFCMGGTLPILTKYFTRNIAASGREVATLYYINSFGAVIGTALAGFLLIRMFSLDGAVIIAAVMNLAIGGAAFMLSGKLPVEAEPVSLPVKAEKEQAHPFSSPSIRLAIVTAALSGFVAMLYELAWTRLLVNIIGSSTYSFSIMLIAFISGITLGSWIVSLMMRKIKNLPAVLSFCQIGTAAAMLLTLPFYERLPYYLLKIATLLSRKPENFPYFLGAEFLFSFALMIVPTTLSGMSLPVASRIASKDFRLLGKTIGSIFSINTLGTVIGAIVAGLLLIPVLGVKATIEIGVALNAVLGMAILFADTSMARQWKIGIAVVIVLLGAGYRLAFPVWDSYVASVGVFRYLGNTDFASFDDFKQNASEGRELLWYREGVNANVAVMSVHNRKANVVQKFLVINGKTDASTVGDMPTQVLLAQVPLMLRPDTGDAMVIGLGSGVTCGSALLHPLRSLDCVEIASEVAECDSFFAAENYHALSDPRLSLHIDDAITYLKVTPKRYDYIISEPTNPWIAGVGNLFSEEFFRLCNERLRPGGVLVQWFHTYEMDNTVFRLIIRTMKQTFPALSIWKISDQDVLVMASGQPLNIDFDAVQKKWSRPSIARDLQRINLFDLPSLLSLQATSHGTPGQLIGEGESNTEKRPLLEYLAPVAFFTGARVTLIDSLDERFAPGSQTLLFSRYEREGKLTAENYINIVGFRRLNQGGDHRLVYAALKKFLRADSSYIPALGLMLEATLSLNLLDEHWATLHRLAAIDPHVENVLSQYLSRTLPTLDKNDPATTEYLVRVAATLSETGRVEAASMLWSSLLAWLQQGRIPGGAAIEEKILAGASTDYLRAGKFEEANQSLKRLHSLNPRNKDLPGLVQVLLQNGKRK